MLRNMKKKEFMGENQNENMLEIQVSNSQTDNSVNQTYKMIMDSQNINNNDFSIEDASSESEEAENSEDEYFEDNCKGKEKYLDNNKKIEPIEEEDGEESKYAPTPQKPITSKIDGAKMNNNLKVKANETEKRLVLDDKNNTNLNKAFKSADAQKQKATLKENKSVNVKQLPPKVPNRSSTSNENPK